MNESSANILQMAQRKKSIAPMALLMVLMATADILVTKDLWPAQHRLVALWNSAVARLCLMEHECAVLWSSKERSSDADIRVELNSA